ncbi:shikimate kinase [Legionella maioricensis]|uniref:Shikimate kinase n=1 Tax=Legionella maioricensis TaxID=2896528 RepID=A0A9X2IA12_9GAMM|nr:shikimate kinase [Legionella maioricensis]MCL9683659.1 LuxR C-terminal-related transcriptional regulator [Legionella maioricensis]MCL9687681.1 LuxR C-terminal-related transcriptional regulator [Legionella maioricensis]
MSHYKRIFIVGQTGAGKALVAKTLAEKLDWQFIDADFGLEFNIGRDLNEILGNQGKEAFYECQSEILAALLKKENIVVATDGSIACSEKNRQLLSSEFVVFLDVSTPIQIERTARNSASLLPIADLKVFFDKFHKERDGFYEDLSSMTVDSDDSALEKHVLSIIDSVLKDKEAKTVDVNLTLDKKDLVHFHKKLHTPVHLSEQQALCLKLLAQGKTSKVIARDLKISYRTVEGTIAKTMELLGCSSSKELIALYYDRS